MPAARYASIPIAFFVASAALTGCGSDDSLPPPPPDVVPSVECSRSGAVCAPVTIIGDPVATTPSFQGYADPSVAPDPRTPGTLWMVYTFLEGRPATSASGAPVGVPHTSTRLARSTDGGSTWTRTAVLWDAPLGADPEGVGPSSYFGSETPSLVSVAEGASVRWFSVRLSYFLEAVSAYSPRYATSWTARIATAVGETPAVLATAPEAVLGVGTTATAYAPTARLNTLSSALATCGFWNNPSITLDGGRLVLLTECMEFDGAQVSEARSRIVVFSTQPTGAPSSWTWRYDGVLTDRAVAVELGASRLVSPDVSVTSTGRRMLLVSLHSGTGLVNQGCVGLELTSLAPPTLARTGGRLRVLARVSNVPDPAWYSGACSHHAASSTGVLAASAVSTSGLQSDLRRTGLRP